MRDYASQLIEPQKGCVPSLSLRSTTPRHSSLPLTFDVSRPILRADTSDIYGRAGVEKTWRRYLRFWRPDPRADVDEELAFHLEMRRRDFEARGLPPDTARAEAERTFGNLPAIRDACVTIDERRFRRANRAEVLSDMWNDLRFAARALRKTPGFAAMAILC